VPLLLLVGLICERGTLMMSRGLATCGGEENCYRLSTFDDDSISVCGEDT